MEALQTYTEMGEKCESISKLCKENVAILRNPIEMLINGEKIIKNNDLIQLHLMVLNNYLNVINERHGDMEEDDGI